MSDSPVAKARWEATQKRLESLEKQVKLLFKLVKQEKEFDPAEEWNKLSETARGSMRDIVIQLLQKQQLSAENSLKLLDWYISFIDSHRDSNNKIEI